MDSSEAKEPARRPGVPRGPGSQKRTALLIDASQLSGESAASGIGTYVRELLGELAWLDDVGVSALATADAVLPTGVARRTVTRRLRQGRPSVWEHEIRRSVELRGARGGVFHNPNPHAPILPVRPWVQTLHDLIPLVFDDPLLAGLKRRFERFGPRYAHADAVIAVSRHAADEGIRLLRLDPRKIEVIHHGASAAFYPDGAPAQDPPYVSVVSEYSKRKGFFEAIGVIQQLTASGYPHRLEFAGRIPDWQQADFRALIASTNAMDRIVVHGFVADLPTFYRRATVHLMTTRYEGFGLPALEAMASGTPVVAFSNSSLPEIIGEAGVLVPDGDIGAMAREVQLILDDPALRKELAERGVRRAATFGWRAGARQHADVYRSVDRP
jgi:glycosyltransferase involved in cell wall biosynthesis